jgi:iron complex transport system substrate-binding protein
VISLDPSNLEEVIADVERLGEAAGVPKRAGELRRELERRLEDVRTAVAGAERPKVLALEWLDPPFIGGHWVPEMIEIGGGRDVLGVPGEKSRTAEWEEIVGCGAAVIVGMPCGWDAVQARAELEAHEDRIAEIGAKAIWAVDAAASFSRPGPRLVEGTELLAHLLHPDRVEAPVGVAFKRVPVAPRARDSATREMLPAQRS